MTVHLDPQGWLLLNKSLQVFNIFLSVSVGLKESPLRPALLYDGGRHTDIGGISEGGNEIQTHSKFLSFFQRETGCAFRLLSALFPWPLWTFLSLYFALSISLVFSATYKYVLHNLKSMRMLFTLWRKEPSVGFLSSFPYT